MQSFLGVRIFFSLLINLEPNTPEYKVTIGHFFFMNTKGERKKIKRKEKTQEIIQIVQGKKKIFI